MNRHFKIAIDGYSSCGKSTLARDLAEELGFLHIDSGAMYRAVSLYLLENEIKCEDTTQISRVVDSLKIDFIEKNGQRLTRLNNLVVEEAIRQQRVSDIVSQVSIIGRVRERMVRLQREMSARHSVIMDGRDIGTVVFPDADVKLFLTAAVETRVHRRWLELKSKNIHTTKVEVKRNLLLRDHIDSTRAIAPLKKAEDATEIDNTHMNRQSQLEYALTIISNKIPGL